MVLRSAEQQNRGSRGVSGGWAAHKGSVSHLPLDVDRNVVVAHEVYGMLHFFELSIAGRISTRFRDQDFGMFVQGLANLNPDHED